MAESANSKYTNFERISPDEQRRILVACIEEFSQSGYEAASTNAIVKRAGIPKGTLFDYFGSKKDLYLYVIDHAVSRFVEAFNQRGGSMPGDLFERLIQRGRARMQFVIQAPRLYQLFFNAFINAPDEIQAELQARYAGNFQTSAQRLLDGLDRPKFRDDIQVEKAVELVNLLLEGLYNRYLPAFKRLSS
jgi:TetR/AcrR family transcriptional regulator